MCIVTLLQALTDSRAYSYIGETGEHRLFKHGYPVGTGRKIRAHRTHHAADHDHYNATYRQA